MKTKSKENEKLYKTFCKNVIKILWDCEIDYQEMADKLQITKYQFLDKLNNRHTKFNFWQIVQIAKELSESVEDLCLEQESRG